MPKPRFAPLPPAGVQLVYDENDIPSTASAFDKRAALLKAREDLTAIYRTYSVDIDREILGLTYDILRYRPS